MIMSRPKGATVFIDDKERGKTPLMLADIKVGFHDIKVTLDDHRIWRKRKRFRPGGNTVEAKLEEKVAAVPATAGKDDKGEAAPSRTDAVAAARAAMAARAAKRKAEKEEKEKIPKTVKVPCPCCGGKGAIDEAGCEKCAGDGFEGANSCGVCAGSGRKAYKCKYCSGNGSIKSSVKDAKEIECRACKGKGAPFCPPCKGTGEISRRNPDAARYETTECISCNGEGWERHLKCNKCGGKGTVTVSHSDATTVYTLEVSCNICKGQGTGPPRCNKCGGRGYRGSGKRYYPCMMCFGTGHLFSSCRTCRGNGWHRMR
jgi:DnaJ-class molecular chaperone